MEFEINKKKKKKLTSGKPLTPPPTPKVQTKPKRKKVSGFAGRGSLKPVPEGNKGKGLSKLPTGVRNKMGFMKKGGKVTPQPKTLKQAISDKVRERAKASVVKGSKGPKLTKTGKQIVQSVKKDFPKLFKRATTKGMKKGGKVVKMRGGGMASRGISFRMR